MLLDGKKEDSFNMVKEQLTEIAASLEYDRELRGADIGFISKLILRRKAKKVKEALILIEAGLKYHTSGCNNFHMEETINNLTLKICRDEILEHTETMNKLIATSCFPTTEIDWEVLYIWLTEEPTNGI